MKELKKLKIRWSGSATINVAFDEELMQLAEESGCKGLLVGLESLNPKTLLYNISKNTVNCTLGINVNASS